jgi:hypothetical protein
MPVSTTTIQGGPSFGQRLARGTVFHPAFWFGVVVWIGLNIAAVVLSGGILPFDRPAVAALPFATQMAFPTVGLLEIFVLMGVVYALTRKRAIPDIASRAPARARAALETIGILTYAMAGQAGGWFLGPALGLRPFSFHLAGTLVGCSTPASAKEAIVWALYNFVVFAAIPYLAFRRRYSNEALNLRSSNRANDALVILVVLVIESATELAAFPGIFKLTTHQLLVAAPLSFLLFGIGTVLPTMILIYSILLPRYLKLTGSFVVTVLLGGATYALMHIVEGWSTFNGPTNTALSLIFVVLTYQGPGMFKSFVTLRTGNAWVHAIAYHAVAPHVIVDAPLMVKAFAIR